jgi:hypothetical protein
MKQFLWVPGQGIDPSALARLRSHFPQPSDPMGEAWFMGDERRMFTELLGDLDRLPVEAFQEPLAELASGTGSFGPQPEWQAWYPYLLGALLPRSHDFCFSYLLESLITGFIALHPNGVHQPPYPAFRDDVLHTLGRCIMDAECWDGSDIAIGNVLCPSNDNPAGVWRWWDASGDLSASLFLCLKYLPEASIAPWLRSVLAIPSPHWRAQMMVWMVGAHDMLTGALRWPSQLSEQAAPSVAWEWSHCLRPELAAADDSGALPVDALLPEGCRLQALHTLRAWFSDDIYQEWLTCVASVPYLAAELGEIPVSFAHLYVGMQGQLT